MRGKIDTAATDPGPSGDGTHRWCAGRSPGIAIGACLSLLRAAIRVMTAPNASDQETSGMSDTGIDRDTMGRLAGALSFIKSPEDAVVVALRKAAESGDERDIKRARTLFLKLKASERQAAMAAISD
jgi:hypothetical protein